MFKSKTRSIIIPQSEHARLAGTLASLWGNTDFDRPAMDFDSFVKGVTFHDRGYGAIDNAPIGAMDEATWLPLMRKGIEQQFSDPVADAIAIMHIKRLLSGDESPGRRQLIALAESTLQQRLQQARLPQPVFDWADRITDLCDSIAFAIAFEAPAQETVSVYARNNSPTSTTITVKVKDGTAVVDPWPFAVQSYAGLILGYHQDGFPEQLDPVMVFWRVQPRA